MSWNERQLEAITARGSSVVISAAAGSGKTSVLTERVLRLIEEGEDIEWMLIVTFTNLAAGEMKERIFRRLQEAGGARLAAQAEKCAFADISTIHAFCGRVIRDNFEQAGVSPSASVADEATIRAMKERAMDDAAESAARSKALRGFLEAFSSRGDMQRIKDAAFAIYDRVISQKEPLAWLERAEANFSTDEFVKVLFDEYKQMVCEAAAEASLHLEKRSAIWAERGFCEDAGMSENERMQMLRTAQGICMQSVCIPRIAQINVAQKGAPNRDSRTHTNRANKCFAGLEAYEGDFYGKARSELTAAKDDAKAFLDITRDFMKRYAALKRQKGVLDHDDLIHFALRALSVPEIAARYREKYSHVFVDEYQDINDAQNAILKLVQRESNAFTVGDVKQCIYMFRESNPELLNLRCAELRNKGLVEMNTNYRSEPGVISFINGVMKHMMTPEAGGVEYSGGQMLEAGRCGEGHADILLASREQKGSLEAEGAAIAAYIKELVREGYRFGDIAVLRHEVSASGRHIAKALEDSGIPVLSVSDADARFSELGVFLNLVALVDGSAGDTALLCVMRYPHFGFTEPELAAVRLAQSGEPEDASFYCAAQTYDKEDVLGLKLKRFFAEIERLRLLSRCLKLPDFLMRLRREAEFCEYALTSPGGAASDSAISSLISTVSAIDGARLGDISGIAERMGAAKQQQKPGEADAVYLTTIHKSKGLEFPAVILSGMHKTINQRDAAGPVLVGRALGLALDIVDGKSRVRKQTLHRMAVARAMKHETISETVRLLYVGMTRASKRLAVLGAGDGIKERWLGPLPEGWQLKATTYFDLIMPAAAAMCAQQGSDINNTVRLMNEAPPEAQTCGKAERLAALFETAVSAPEADMCAVYRYESDLGVPSKVSVSALKRVHEPQVIRPQYAPSDDTVSAAERGTLMHRLLQKIGFESKSEHQVRARIEELAREGTIDARLAEYADPMSISRFLHSPLAERARNAARRLVEAPFCLGVKASELGLRESDESVIVQGVIDMCFLEDGRWVVVDYKTDSIRGSLEEAAAKYNTQLSLYARALEEITGCPVKEKTVYFLSVGQAVSLQ